MSRVVSRRSVPGIGRAIAAVGLAVAMLTGAAGVANALAVPPLTIRDQYGQMPNGTPITDFRILDRHVGTTYSSTGKQSAEFVRDITWSEQREAVRVQLQGRGFDYKSGWFWFNNSFRVETAVEATLTGPGGFSRTYRDFRIVNGTSGVVMHSYLPFEDAGTGTYCIRTTGTVKGIGGSAQMISSTRSSCFQR